MDFYLRYRGPLPSASRSETRVNEKHDIRAALSPQLRDFWMKAPQLELLRASIDDLFTQTVKGGRVEVPKPRETLYDFLYNVEFKKCFFTPLITRSMELTCQLDIRFLRRERPGANTQGGDLDNRLKTLLDGLRIPMAEDEIPNSLSPGERYFCLLEDDSLVTHLNIETSQLFGPLDGHEKENDVDLSIHVTVKVALLMMVNMSWGS